MRKIISTLWDRVTRNDINDNFEVLFNDVGNISGKITDEVYEEIKNNVNLKWKEPVETVADLPSDAEAGDTRMIEGDGDDYGKVYRYNGSEWVNIQHLNPDALLNMESRLTEEINKKESPEGAQDKANNAESNANKYTDDEILKVYNDDDVLKVVESGSNANGNYVRYSDGMQYCWGTVRGGAVNEKVGELYRSESHRIDYPKPFSERPTNISLGVQNVNRWADISGRPSVDFVSFRQFSHTSNSNSFDVGYSVFGRWK